MISEKIKRLRKKMDDSITNNKDYAEIYKLSVELDVEIAKYYQQQLKVNHEVCMC